MRTEKFKSALLSTLLIVSLTAPIITLLSVSSATPVFASPENIIVRGDANAVNDTTTGPPPWKWYAAGDYPPIMAAKRVVAGAVVAAGTGRTANGGGAYVGPVRWTVGELDVFLDKAFQWMVPGATKVLWYGKYWEPTVPGENYQVYNDAARCLSLIDSLRAKGYTVDNKYDAPITSATLAGYDILVLPGLQIGEIATGGDPTKLHDTSVTAIKAFVEGGKGLFIMESGDHDGHNYYRVQNKILDALGFGLRFQMDKVVDPDEPDPYYVTAEVTTDLFGADYIAAAGKTTIRVYKVCTLAPRPEKYGVRVEFMPRYREGLAGGTLEYRVRVYNTGENKDNFNLSASGPVGWTLWLENTTLEIENVENLFNYRDTRLRVTIPPGTSIGTVENVTVTATSEDNSLATHSPKCLAIVGDRIRPSTADTQVVENKRDENKNFGFKTFMYIGSSATGPYLDERIFLKFDLKAMGTTSVENVRLYLYPFTMMGKPDQTVQLHRIDTAWEENEITWLNQPSLGAAISTATVIDSDLWCSWDIKDYVAERRGADNLANLALSYVLDDRPYPDNWSYGFDTKEYAENLKHPYLAVGRSVRAVARSSYNEGMRNGTLKYTVLIQNVGALHDTYNLTVSDNASPSWSPTVSPSSLTLAPGAFGYATVTVTIPSTAPIGENIDNITVVATSASDPGVSDSCSFVANVSATNIKPPKDDSTARQAEPVGNWVWGTDDTIYVGRYFEGPERGFLKFDLSAIPPGTSIARAELWAHADKAETGGAIVQVRSVADDAWVERSRGAGRLMWDNQPSIGGVLDIRSVIESGWYSWDVTSFVASEFAGDKVASFALVDLGENISPDHRARFTSKEGKENHPYLKILTALPAREVRVYISPVFQGSSDNAATTTLSYTVTIANRGSSADTYTLETENLDALDFSMSISPTSLSVPAGENRTATLSVTVLPGAACALDRIKVTATGTGVSDSAVCFAHRGRAFFIKKLFNVYTVPENLDLRLRDDGRLLVKFYKWDSTYQGENVFWNIAPAHLKGEYRAKHPLAGTGVENAHLVLKLGDGTEIILDVFTVRRSHLLTRISGIKSEWPYAEDRSALIKEISTIKSMWPYAPT